jgi:hypothetical protein
MSDSTTTLRASRYRVARSRGAASGALLLLLGAWAALVPFIGPYLNVAYTPQPDTAWHWTAARGWLEVLPGAVVALGGLLLIMSASRLVTSFAAWLAAAGGAWLLVGPALSGPLEINLGSPDPTSRRSVQSLTQLLFFYGIGAVIVFLAGLALGRLTVNSVRDVRAAERRLAADDAAASASAGAPEGPVGGAGTSGAPAYTPEQRTGFLGRHQQSTSDAPEGGAPSGPPTTQQPPVAAPAHAQPSPNPPTAQQPTYAPAPPPPRNG